MSYPVGSLPLAARRRKFFTRVGARRLSWKLATPSATFFHRATAYAAFAGSQRRGASARGSREGSEMTYVGERWSMVTCAARSAIAGTRVTAVAPLPITTTRLPV